MLYTILGGSWRQKVVSVFLFRHPKRHFLPHENGHFLLLASSKKCQNDTLYSGPRLLAGGILGKTQIFDPPLPLSRTDMLVLIDDDAVIKTMMKNMSSQVRLHQLHSYCLLPPTAGCPVELPHTTTRCDTNTKLHTAHCPYSCTIKLHTALN